MASLSASLKYLFQLGPRPLALYGLYKFGLITGHYKRVTPVFDIRKSSIELSTSYPKGSIAHLFPLPNREQLKQILGDDGQQALLAEADEILDGKFRLFGSEPVDIKLTLDGPLHHWTAYERNPQLLSNLQSLVSDIKFLWEPARFGFAFPLGRAYHLTQDNKYAEAFWKYFETFTEANPVNCGPHWMNGQEVAIRMMTLVWAAHAFETAPASSPERRGALLQSILQHATRIPPTLVYARSQNNNHLVTESAAMYTAGLFFKNPKWSALGWKWLNWAFQNQIGDYGEYIQHSTNYHRLMLQTALWVNLIKQDVFSAITTQALGRSAHWLFSLLDGASGRTPNLGANDGASILPLSVTPFNDFRPTVQAAARAFLRTGISPGVWDEMSLWLGLKETARVTDSDAYITDNLRGQNSWAYLRASRFKSRLSHIDQLHLDLWWRGLNIAQDAGTYSYHAEPPWENPLVTTRVHNTVTVDGRDQMTRAGKFLVLDWVNAYSKTEIAADENAIQQVEAYLRGYRKPHIRHERTVTVYNDDHWVVWDNFIFERLKLKFDGFKPPKETHLFRIHWLLPDWEWQIVETPSDKINGVGYDLNLLSPHGRMTVRLWLDYFFATAFEDQFTVGLARAGESVWGNADVQTIDGWVSPSYGNKMPALSFSMTAASEGLPSGFVTEFIFPK